MRTDCIRGGCVRVDCVRAGCVRDGCVPTGWIRVACVRTDWVRGDCTGKLCTDRLRTGKLCTGRLGTGRLRTNLQYATYRSVLHWVISQSIQNSTLERYSKKVTREKTCFLEKNATGAGKQICHCQIHDNLCECFLTS